MSQKPDHGNFDNKPVMVGILPVALLACAKVAGQAPCFHRVGRTSQ